LFGNILIHLTFGILQNHSHKKANNNIAFESELRWGELKKSYYC